MWRRVTAGVWPRGLIRLLVFVAFISFSSDAGFLGMFKPDFRILASNASVSTRTAFETGVTSRAVETASSLQSESLAFSIYNIYSFFPHEVLVILSVVDIRCLKASLRFA